MNYTVPIVWFTGDPLSVAEVILGGRPTLHEPKWIVQVTLWEGEKRNVWIYQELEGVYCMRGYRGGGTILATSESPPEAFNFGVPCPEWISNPNFVRDFLCRRGFTSLMPPTRDFRR